MIDFYTGNGICDQNKIRANPIAESKMMIIWRQEIFMIIQISAGQAKPEECQLAVGMLFHALQKEYSDIIMTASKSGTKRNCYESLQFQTEHDLSSLDGTVQWICNSPFRPKHKRKNWFIDVSIIPEAKVISTDQEYRIEKFHCGGKGGQNVNKVETGVRVIHIPTGLTASSREERSQHRNRQRAMEKIQELLKQQEKDVENRQNNQAWKEHGHIVRGNPVRVYSGMEFKRVK